MEEKIYSNVSFVELLESSFIVSSKISGFFWICGEFITLNGFGSWVWLASINSYHPDEILLDVKMKSYVQVQLNVCQFAFQIFYRMLRGGVGIHWIYCRMLLSCMHVTWPCNCFIFDGQMWCTSQNRLAMHVHILNAVGSLSNSFGGERSGNLGEVSDVMSGSVTLKLDWVPWLAPYYSSTSNEYEWI